MVVLCPENSRAVVAVVVVVVVVVAALGASTAAKHSSFPSPLSPVLFSSAPRAAAAAAATRNPSLKKTQGRGRFIQRRHSPDSPGCDAHGRRTRGAGAERHLSLLCNLEEEAAACKRIAGEGEKKISSCTLAHFHCVRVWNFIGSAVLTWRRHNLRNIRVSLSEYSKTVLKASLPH